MARIVTVPGMDKFIGSNFDAVNKYVLANGMFRNAAFLPKYDAIRQSRVAFSVPYPDSHVPRGGSYPFDLATYPVLVNGSTSEYTVTPVGQDHVIYNIGDYSQGKQTNDSVHIQYDLKTRKVTNIYEYSDNGDTWFNNHVGALSWAIGNAAMNAMTGGASAVFLAVGNASVSVSNGGSLTSAAITVAASYASAPAAPEVTAVSSTGSTAVDDFDYEDVFDSTDFSDGEAFTAFSDSENVDFGFGMGSPGDFSEAATDPADFAVLDEPDDLTQALGTTPEPATGFGTTPDDGTFDYGVDANSNLAKNIGTGTSVAQTIAKIATPATKQTSTGGGTKNSQTATTVSSIIAPASATSQGSGSMLDTALGLASQLETGLNKTFTGQYKPNTGAAAPVATTGGTNMILYLGLAAIAVALLMKGK